MRITVKMPKVGDSVDEVTIVEWIKAVGDPIYAGEALVLVETNKATVAVPCPVSGIVVELLPAVDADVRTGMPIAVLESNDGR